MNFVNNNQTLKLIKLYNFYKFWQTLHFEFLKPSYPCFFPKGRGELECGIYIQAIGNHVLFFEASQHSNSSISFLTTIFYLTRPSLRVKTIISFF